LFWILESDRFFEAVASTVWDASLAVQSDLVKYITVVCSTTQFVACTVSITIHDHREYNNLLPSPLATPVLNG